MEEAGLRQDAELFMINSASYNKCCYSDLFFPIKAWFCTTHSVVCEWPCVALSCSQTVGIMRLLQQISDASTPGFTYLYVQWYIVLGYLSQSLWHHKDKKRISLQPHRHKWSWLMLEERVALSSCMCVHRSLLLLAWARHGRGCHWAGRLSACEVFSWQRSEGCKDTNHVRKPAEGYLSEVLV